MKKYDADQPGYDLSDLAITSGDVASLRAPALIATNITAARLAAPQIAAAQSHALYRNGAKRVLETLLIFLSLPFFLPVVALCALALWIEGGNPFYRQDRLGRNGKVFSIIKLRTMVRDADEVLENYLANDPDMRREWDEKQKIINDPRVTRVGAALRASSLDEIPQLWNVLTGEMSLIGPRPMMPDQLEIYGNPSQYFAMRPGITGLWQVSARNENSFAFRNEVDATYNQSLSLWGDIKIIFQTVGVMLRRTGH